eukprot:gene21725-27778_t
MVIPTFKPTNLPTFIPSKLPSEAPSCKPTAIPTLKPTLRPTVQPSVRPTRVPSMLPSSRPTSIPTSTPSSRPTSRPTSRPSTDPTAQPSSQPSSRPSAGPNHRPTPTPSSTETSPPSSALTGLPTAHDTSNSTFLSEAPSPSPTVLSTFNESIVSTVSPTCVPRAPPSQSPSVGPSESRTAPPSAAPTIAPSQTPVSLPSRDPSFAPSPAGTTLGSSVLMFSASQHLGNVSADSFQTGENAQLAFRSAVSASVSPLLTAESVDLLSVSNTNNTNSAAARRRLSSLLTVSKKFSVSETESQNGVQILYEIRFTVELLGFTDAQTAFVTTSAQLQASVLSGNFTSFLHQYAVLYRADNLLHSASTSVNVSSSYVVWIQSPQPSVSPSALPSQLNSTSALVSSNGAGFGAWPVYGRVLLIVAVILAAALCCCAAWWCLRDEEESDLRDEKVARRRGTGHNNDISQNEVEAAPQNRFSVRLPSMLMGSDEEDEEAGFATQTQTQSASFATPPQKRAQSTGTSQTDDYASPYDHYLLSSPIKTSGGSGKLSGGVATPSASQSTTGFGAALSERLLRNVGSPWRKKAVEDDDELHPLDYAAHSEKRAAAARASKGKEADLEMAQIYRSKSRSPDTFSRENML